MEKIEAELYGNHIGNNAVLRVPGRRYAGVLIQGDTLRSIHYLVDTIANSNIDPNNVNLLECIRDLSFQINDIVEHYDSIDSDKIYKG